MGLWRGNGEEAGERQVGLALGGGAVLGAAHVGVLRAMDELGLGISMLTGTSIGSFIAALRAFGMGWREIGAIALELGWLDLSSLSLSQYGLLSNRKFGEMVNDLLGRKNIEEAELPLALVATDIEHGRKVVLRRGDVASAVMASSCIPGLFRPVAYNGMLLVDGVLVENVPVSPLLERPERPVVCVDLLAGHEYRRPENIVDILLNSFYSAITTVTGMQTAEADLVIAPDLTAFSLVEVSQVAEIIEAGYREALRALTPLAKGDLFA